MAIKQVKEDETEADLTECRPCGGVDEYTDYSALLECSEDEHYLTAAIRYCEMLSEDHYKEKQSR